MTAPRSDRLMPRREHHRRTQVHTPDLAEALGRLLRLWRWQAAMTLDQVGCSAGMHRPVVGRLESGLRSPSIDSLVRYARATGGDVRQAFALVDIWLAPKTLGLEG